MATTDLRDLHQLLLQLEEVEEKIARGPRVIAVHRRRAEQQEADIAAERETLLNLRKSADAKSLNLKSNEAKIVGLRTKLNQARTNIEFETFKGQIEADEMANSVLEDEILEVLDKIDATEAGIADIEGQLAATREEERATTERVAAAESGLQSEAATLRASITEAEGGLKESFVEKYRRLVAAHGAGALAAMQGKVCSACYVELEQQVHLEVKAGKSIFCRSCGRLLYLGEDAEG